MLRSNFVALACFAFVSSVPAFAEPASSAASVVAKADDDTLSGDAAAASESGGATSTEQPAAATTGTPESAPAGKPVTAAEPAKPAPAPDPTLTAAINLSSQTITVSVNGVARYTWAISSGTRSHPTPRGSFRPQWTAKMWYSRKYDNAPMPHAVFVHNGVAIHATYATGMLGRPASHGCIRLSPTNAKTFYDLVQRHGTRYTRVSIYGTPKWGADPYVADRKVKQPAYAAAAQSDSDWDWFGFSSKPAAKPAYPAPGYAYGNKKRKPGQMYYYSQNGNVYVVKPNPNAKAKTAVRVPGKKYYYNGYGYGYSSNW